MKKNQVREQVSSICDTFNTQCKQNTIDVIVITPRKSYTKWNKKVNMQNVGEGDNIFAITVFLYNRDEK